MAGIIPSLSEIFFNNGDKDGLNFSFPEIDRYWDQKKTIS